MSARDSENQPPPGAIIFFGTPDFAVPTLEALCDAHLAPLLVLTQPARAAGRGRQLVEPPVARRARELELPVESVASVREDDFLRRLTELEPWVAVVVAFGQIFPRSLLEIPTAGCVNLHASLLPEYRGAAPIQAAIASGERRTGVTTMKMTEGLDSGPILLQKMLTIGERETAPELASRLAEAGARLMVETLVRLGRGELTGREQDDAEATLAPKLSRADGIIDWRWPSQRIFDRWRAFTPWPGIAARFRDRAVKIRGCRIGERKADGASPGIIVEIDDGLYVACGDDSTLVLLELQRPDRAPIEARAFVNGERVRVGDRFEVLP